MTSRLFPADSFPRWTFFNRNPPRTYFRDLSPVVKSQVSGCVVRVHVSNQLITAEELYAMSCTYRVSVYLFICDDEIIAALPVGSVVFRNID